MKRLVKQIGYLVMMGIVFSCSEKIEPTPFDYTKIFSGETSKTWKLKSIAFKNAGDPDWKLTEPCWSDDSYTFYRDDERKFEFETGSVKCDPSEEPYVIIDTWSFSNASATLYFVIPILADFPLPYTVIDVDKNDLELQIFFDDAGSQSYQLKFESEDF